MSVLADRINDMLDSYAGGEGAEHAAAEVEDNAPLDTPIEDEFRVNTLSLGWDEAREVVVIECLDRDPDEVPEEVEADPVLSEEPRLIRVVLTPARARAFARRCQAVSPPAALPAPSAVAPSRLRATSARAPTGTSADQRPGPATPRRRARSPWSAGSLEASNLRLPGHGRVRDQLDHGDLQASGR